MKLDLGAYPTLDRARAQLVESPDRDRESFDKDLRRMMQSVSEEFCRKETERLKVAEHMVDELQKDNTRLVEEKRAAVEQEKFRYEGRRAKLQGAVMEAVRTAFVLHIFDPEGPVRR